MTIYTQSVIGKTVSSLLTTVALVFISYRVGLDFRLTIFFLVPFLFLQNRIVYVSNSLIGRQADHYVPMFLAAMAFIFILTNFKYGYVLPAHDPIAIPLLSKYIHNGLLSLDSFPAGSSAYSYPPGYPILVSPLWFVLSAQDFYFAFKIINILVVSLIPLSWAWMLHKIFFRNFSFSFIVILSYLSFFGLERTLGFALPFAGKNAILIGVLLAPVLFVWLTRFSSSKFAWAFFIIPFFGLVLLHYSMLHLMAALVGGYVLSEFLAGNLRCSQFFKLFFVGLGVSALLFLFLSEAIYDPRSTGFSWSPLDGFKSMIGVVFSEKSAITIFMDADFGMSKSTYRGLFLVLAVFFSVVIGLAINDKGLIKASAFSAFSLFLALIMSFNIVPSGLSLDFGRWFFWSQQAAVFLVFLIALSLLASKFDAWLKSIVILVLVSIFIIGGFNVRGDFSVFKEVNKSQVITRSDLLKMITTIDRTVGDRECSLVSNSISFPERLIVVQPSKLWEYAESASQCTFINGSWMQPGEIGGREIDGFPALNTLESALSRGAVMFLGSEASLKGYVEILNKLEFSVGFSFVDEVGGIDVWLLEGPR